ncbi:hypothetical protein [Pseudoxanthomonas koreensis]|uniref:hypothetical protein n=1 Tax=Pseudoxanthomonas koreensis TaxID=266061 RepID=UPI0035A7393A
MMDPKQAEAVADAIMLEQRAARAASAQEKLAKDRRLLVQRRVGSWALCGMGIGALIGHFAFGQWFPSAMVGLGLGGIIGRWFPGRRA